MYVHFRWNGASQIGLPGCLQQSLWDMAFNEKVFIQPQLHESQEHAGSDSTCHVLS